MSIKRFIPKYKKLARFKQPIWLEKRGKVKKFNRQKWEYLKKSYFPKKFKFFNQDIATCTLGKSFNDDKVIRLKKTYKFLLLDKQRLQFYFGGGRLKYYQLKNLVKSAVRLSRYKKFSTSTAFLYLLDNRLKNAFYRLGFFFSTLQANKFISCGHVKINNNTVLNSFYTLKKGDFVFIDPGLVFKINLYYLKFNFPFFFIRQKRHCCSLISKKALSFSDSFVVNNQVTYYNFVQSKLNFLKEEFFNVLRVSQIKNKIKKK